jgi:hypothetical protein
VTGASRLFNKIPVIAKVSLCAGKDPEERLIGGICQLVNHAFRNREAVSFPDRKCLVECKRSSGNLPDTHGAGPVEDLVEFSAMVMVMGPQFRMRGDLGGIERHLPGAGDPSDPDPGLLIRWCMPQVFVDIRNIHGQVWAGRSYFFWYTLYRDPLQGEFSVNLRNRSSGWYRLKVLEGKIGRAQEEKDQSNPPKKINRDHDRDRKSDPDQSDFDFHFSINP